MGHARRIVPAALAAVAAIVLTLAVPAVASAQTPTRGGMLKILVYPEPPHLNVGLSQASGVMTIASKIYQSLLTYDFELRPQPSLAKSWSVSDDGRTYTFKLQDGVKWHDGKPFTAADVVFSTQEFLMTTHPRARAVFSRVARVETPDDLTVVYHLKERYSPFIYAFELSSAPIVPKHVFAGGDYDKNPNNQAPTGTGPFKFKDWKRGEQLTIVRNDNYWKPGLPYLDGITFHFIPDPTARTIALEQGMVDQAQFDAVQLNDLARLRRNKDLVFEAKGQEFISPLVLLDMNSRVAPMDDKRFRKAVMHSIDRKFVRDNIFYGQGEIPTGPISSTTRYYDPKVTLYDYDPQKAIQLLDEMGLKPNANGVRAEVKILSLPYGENWTRFGEYLREALRKIGVRAQIENTDPSTWIQRYTNWDYGITFTYFYQYADPALGVARTYLCSNVRKVFLANANGYCDKKVDKLWEEATQELDEGKKQTLYSEIQRIITDDVPVGWILELKFPVIHRKSVHQTIMSSIGPNDSYDQAYIAK